MCRQNPKSHLAASLASLIQVKYRLVLKQLLRLKNSDVWTRPWIGWAFLYTFVLVIFSTYRVVYFQDLIMSTQLSRTVLRAW
ncbi:hypothetical protein GQ600_9462 [Phytophthora cactorum]|nr:hypothetical protein GQ600_9462 [Phytophthora cactorum]